MKNTSNKKAKPGKFSLLVVSWWINVDVIYFSNVTLMGCKAEFYYCDNVDSS